MVAGSWRCLHGSGFAMNYEHGCDTRGSFRFVPCLVSCKTGMDVSFIVPRLSLLVCRS